MLLSNMHALLGCLGIATAYVALLYTMSPAQLPRIHPFSIKQRTKAVILACALSWLPLFFMIGKDSGVHTLLHHLGLRLHGLVDAAMLSLLLTSVLFTGPIYYHTLTYWTTGEPLLVVDFHDLVFLRNIIIAPLVEEFCFRACMVPLLLLQGYPIGPVVLLTPLLFGAAHLHHLRERVVHEGAPLAQALAVVLFQFTYTTMFGWYATYLFIRTGHLVAPVLSHALCNALGLPPVVQMVQHKQRWLMMVLLVAGAVGFAWLLQPLTAPGLYQ